MLSIVLALTVATSPAASSAHGRAPSVANWASTRLAAEAAPASVPPSGLIRLRQVGLAALGMLGGIIAGGLIGPGLACGGTPRDDACAFMGAAYGIILGVTVGASTGVWLGGDGRGTFWGALGGAAIAVVPALIAALFAPAAFFAVLGSLVLAPLGAIVGYEYWRRTDAPPPSAPTTALGSIAPFTTSAGNPALAVVGRF